MTRRGTARSGPTPMPRHALRGMAAILLAGLIGAATDARAACNFIPGAANTFPGTAGLVDRPFAAPGDLVAVRAGCSGPELRPTAAEHVVTVIFSGASDSVRRAVVLTADCNQVDLAPCAGSGSPDACCRTLETNPLVGASDLSMRMQGYTRELRFRFPDTDDLLDGPADDLTLAGPATITVTAVGDPLPLDLLTPGASCAGHPNRMVCVDRLFAPDGVCPPTDPDLVMTHFVALPPPNDFSDVCRSGDSCRGFATTLRLAVDREGNLLLPMDWRGVHFGDGSLPIARLLRGRSDVAAFPDGSAPIQLPTNAFLASFSPEGAPLPPILDPQVSLESVDELTLFGTADAPASVLRIARYRGVCAGGENAERPCASALDCPGGACPAACAGGSRDGLRCGHDGECPGGRCGQLFDFASRTVSPLGPLALDRTAAAGPAAHTSARAGIISTRFDGEAVGPAALDGLAQSDTVNSFVLSEGLTGQRLNVDADERDDVMQLADRTTGLVSLIGDGGTVGRAVVRVRQTPYSFPAAAVEKDWVVFLESEPGEGHVDANGNGRVADALLRVYEREPPGSFREVTSDLRTVDPAPRVNGRPLVLSEGRVFYRRSEAAQARYATRRLTAGVQFPYKPSISGDGRLVSFAVVRTDDIFTLGALEYLDALALDWRTSETHLISANPAGSEGGWVLPILAGALLSHDGRFALFSSLAPLVPDDTNDAFDLFRRDLWHGVTRRVSLRTDGTEHELGGGLGGGDMSDDGRFVCFTGPSPFPGSSDAWGMTVVDLERIETGDVVAFVPADLSDGGTLCSLSGDGRFVAFATLREDLVPGDTNGVPDVFVYESTTGATERVSIGTNGEQANATSHIDPSSVSRDGRFVAFLSTASNLVPGDTNGGSDVFVRDRLRGTTERVTVASDGSQADRSSRWASISGDGRYVLFESAATNLVPDDVNGTADFFIHDRVTGVTECVSVDAAGRPAGGSGAFLNFEGNTRGAEISTGGRYVAFQTAAPNLVPNDPAIDSDIFVRGPDLDDLASDLFPDGELDDTVLEVFDARAGVATTLCPADEVAVSRGRAAFLRPASAFGTATCPPSGDGNADESRRVVHLLTDDLAVRDLGRPATAVALSDTFLAALVPDAADPSRTLVAAHPVDGDEWMDTGQAGDTIAVCGDVVAFLTPAEQAGPGNRILQLFDARTRTLVNVGETALDVVCSPTLVAFRTPRAPGGGQPSGERVVGVLQAYDIGDPECLAPSDRPANCLVSSGSSAVPCPSEACDPRLPYRALGSTVRFLTLEADEERDLNGDDDQNDLVLQILNVAQARANGAGLTPVGATPLGIADASAPSLGADAPGLTAVGAAPLGICTTTGEACVDDEDCGAGRCFLPPGGCVLDLGTPCDPDADEACDTEAFCQPTPGQPGSGTCHIQVGACTVQSDCPTGAFCQAVGDPVARLVSPLTAPDAGAMVFSSAGRCVETLGPCPCAAGAHCENGTCRREHGTCGPQAACPAGTACEPTLVVAASSDTDRDEVPDHLDNCPTVPNSDQRDANGNGIGEACELCPPNPVEDCAAPDAAGGRIRLADRGHDTSRRLAWRWAKGPAVSRASLGDPSTSTSYAFCVYDTVGGASQLVTSIRIPAGGRCGTRPCWRASSSGVRYVSPVRLGDGIHKLTLRAGAAGRGRITLTGRGAGLALPALPLAKDPAVRVQLRNAAGGCWDVRFRTARENTATKFQATSQ